MPFHIPTRPIADAVARVWRLLCDGVPAGSYTDHCNRAFIPGDRLRDDRDNRRTVISLSVLDRFTLHVSSPDIAGPAAPAIG